jgi:hypothetical protein
MRALSAIGFFISIVGFLLVCYNQFGIVPYLNNLNGNLAIQDNEFTNSTRLQYEHILSMISTISLIIGVFSVLFCSLVYLRKRTRMTLIGTILGFATTVLAVLHTWL